MVGAVPCYPAIVASLVNVVDAVAIRALAEALNVTPHAAHREQRGERVPRAPTAWRPAPTDIAFVGHEGSPAWVRLGCARLEHCAGPHAFTRLVTEIDDLHRRRHVRHDV